MCVLVIKEHELTLFTTLSKGEGENVDYMPYMGGFEFHQFINTIKIYAKMLIV